MKVRKLLFVVALFTIVCTFVSAFPSQRAQAASYLPHVPYAAHPCPTSDACSEYGAALGHISSCSSPRWQTYGPASQVYVKSHGSTACNYANWNQSGYTGVRYCDFWVWVPINGYANAQVTYGFFGLNGNFILNAPINQATAGGWTALAFNVQGVGYIHIADNDGQTSSYIGVDNTTASMAFDRCHG